MIMEKRLMSEYSWECLFKIKKFFGPKNRVFRGKGLYFRIAKKTGLNSWQIFEAIKELQQQGKVFCPGSYLYESGINGNLYWYPNCNFGPRDRNAQYWEWHRGFGEQEMCTPLRSWIEKEGIKIDS